MDNVNYDNTSLPSRNETIFDNDIAFSTNDLLNEIKKTLRFLRASNIDTANAQIVTEKFKYVITITKTKGDAPDADKRTGRGGQFPYIVNIVQYANKDITYLF